MTCSQSPRSRETFPNENVVKTSQVDDVKPLRRDQLSSAVLASGPAVPHYEEGQFCSVRHAAALQGYPNDYEFFGNKSQQYKQVGNLVPVGLASAIARLVSRPSSRLSGRDGNA